MSVTNSVKTRARIGRWAAFLIMVSLIGAYALMTARKNVSSDKPSEISKYVPWSEAAIDASRDIAFQDGGRIKPFSTWAGFNMLNLYGSRSMKITVGGEKVKLKPEHVMLDCLFRPELARELPLFRIDNDEVLASLASVVVPAGSHGEPQIDPSRQKELVNGVLEGKGKRDRYSFNELEPVLFLLGTQAQVIEQSQPDKAKMRPAQRRTIDLAQQIFLFRKITHHFDFARADIPLESSSATNEGMARMSYWIKSFPVLVKAVREMNSDQQGLPPKLQNLFSELQGRMIHADSGVHMIPSYDKGENEWVSVGLRMEKIVSGDTSHSRALVEDMVKLEDVTIALNADTESQEGFTKALMLWKASVHERIGGEVVDTLSSEVKYTQRNYFFNALVVFLIASLFVMTGWLAPQTRFARCLSYIAIALSLYALGLMVVGITHRCLIMDRSPVGNLYDTIIFIATTGVFVLLIVELLTRRMVALGLAVFMGLICMFLARRYEVGDGKDHMDPLVAVLKSNFWLSTHVVTVTIGYMGGLASAGLSVIYIFARVLGIDEGDKSFRRAMTRIAYGMICFTLFFSLIGTVLGGIWANDSWGRFWGWDPKENGALMIVLWCLVLLHARLAGYLREWGVHVASVFGANIVAFSWWHVNSLSTGLHSYGFIDGIGAIWGLYAIMSSVCMIGLIAAFVTNRRQKLV